MKILNKMGEITAGLVFFVLFCVLVLAVSPIWIWLLLMARNYKARSKSQHSIAQNSRSAN